MFSHRFCTSGTAHVGLSCFGRSRLKGFGNGRCDVALSTLSHTTASAAAPHPRQGTLVSSLRELCLQVVQEAQVRSRPLSSSATFAHRPCGALGPQGVHDIDNSAKDNGAPFPEQRIPQLPHSYHTVTAQLPHSYQTATDCENIWFPNARAMKKEYMIYENPFFVQINLTNHCVFTIGNCLVTVR